MPTEPRRIRVNIPAKRETAFTFDNVDAALASYSENPRRLRAERDSRTIRGSILNAVEYGPREVRFSLTGDRSIRIWLEHDVPQWKITSKAEQLATVEDSLPETVVLDWQPIEELWRRKNILEKRLGLSVNLLSAGFVDILVYVEGLLILRFSPLINVDTGELFLYWSEID